MDGLFSSHLIKFEIPDSIPSNWGREKVKQEATFA